MMCSCPTGDGSLRHPCQAHPCAAPAESAPRLLSQLEGQVVHSIYQLEADAARLERVLGSMADIDPHAVERAMIALRRATAQLRGVVTHSQACANAGHSHGASLSNPHDHSHYFTMGPDPGACPLPPAGAWSHAHTITL